MPSPLVLFALALLGLAAASSGAPLPDRFPPSWGNPPAATTFDLVPLPGGYGFGSSTEARWAAQKIESDRDAGRVRFPPAWGEPPAMQTRDLVPLPFGYGLGSGTLRNWLLESAKASGWYTAPQLHAAIHEALQPQPLGHHHYERHTLTPPPTGMGSIRTGTRFPPSWGEPPAIQTADYRPLPGGYGHGSSTLAGWITAKIAADAQNGALQFPPEWGQPPAAQTRDMQPLPLGYGMGSSTLGRWILDHAQRPAAFTVAGLDKLNPSLHPTHGGRLRLGDFGSTRGRGRD